MAKYKSTKKKYDNKKKKQQPTKLTAKEQKQIARAAKKKEEKKRAAERKLQEAQRIQGKKEKLKTLQQQKAKTTDSQRLMGLLLTKITKGGHNPNTVLNDTTILKAFLREIIVEQPSLEDAANNLLVSTKKRLEEGVFRDEAKIDKLVREFQQNPLRKTNMDNIPYDTGMLDMNAGIYTEAVFRLFKEEAKSKGINETSFRRALDYYLASKPYELYEGSLNSKGNISRAKKLKAPRDIADMAMSKTLSLNNVRVV